jgi:hypothetical protein
MAMERQLALQSVDYKGIFESLGIKENDLDEHLCVMSYRVGMAVVYLNVSGNKKVDENLAEDYRKMSFNMFAHLVTSLVLLHGDVQTRDNVLQSIENTGVYSGVDPTGVVTVAAGLSILDYLEAKSDKVRTESLRKMFLEESDFSAKVVDALMQK